MSEHHEQVALFQWAAYQANTTPELEMLFAVPNGGHRHKATAGKMKAEGQKAGVPDVWLPVPRCGCHGLIIEMKYGKGRVRPNQKWWLNSLTRLGYKTAVCYSFEEAREVLESYLEIQ